jgi:hypothetical protein
LIIYTSTINHAPYGIFSNPSPLHIAENSGSGVLIGNLLALDIDVLLAQTFKFSLVDSFSGRFSLTPAGALSVAASNTVCLQRGGASCLLNFEAQSQYTLQVMVTDSGTPPLSATFPGLSFEMFYFGSVF